VYGQTSTATSESPFRIPGYDLQEMIGEGGMGMVFRALQHQLPRTVAVKFLRSPMPGSPAAAAFLDESRLMARLSHPHVVAIHDCGQVDGRPYLVMEYVSGSSLRAVVQPGRPWLPDRSGRVLAAVASALSYIHGQGILHLDLKPENVLLGDDGSIKVTDFGLARPGADGPGTLVPPQGTVDYCPPEQRFGLAVDRRADLFSLATLAYELLTGRLPGRVYVPCSRRQPGLPHAVDEVLARGLARHPEDRHATVEAFWEGLRPALEDGPSAPETTGGRTGQTGRSEEGMP
jgi:serine/threonine protein kinase